MFSVPQEGKLVKELGKLLEAQRVYERAVALVMAELVMWRGIR